MRASSRFLRSPVLETRRAAVVVLEAARAVRVPLRLQNHGPNAKRLQNVEGTFWRRLYWVRCSGAAPSGGRPPLIET